MTWRLTDEEFQTLLVAPPETRYRYFLDHVADEERVWTLDDGNEHFVLAVTNEHRLLPLWPHKRYVEEALVQGPWRDATPLGFHVEHLLASLVRDAAADGLLFVIFPVGDGEQCLVAPDELERDLRDELAKY